MQQRGDSAGSLDAFLVENGIEPGDRLPPERQLAADLGISRASLREAMRRLIDLGIVEPRQGSGNYVTPPDLEDLLEVRLRIEPYAARLAAERRDDAQLVRLEGSLAELRPALSDPQRFAAADARLHTLIAETAASVTLRFLLAALADLLRYSRAATAQDPEMRAETVERLEELVAAIRRGDGASAERAMHAHLEDAGLALARRRPPLG